MDQQLVKWLATLPTSLKVRGQEVTVVLKKAMEPLLPDDELFRPKTGSCKPLEQWFRGPRNQRARGAAAGARLGNTAWLLRPFAQQLMKADQLGDSDYRVPSWKLLMFESFLRNAVDDHGAMAEAPRAHVAAERVS